MCYVDNKKVINDYVRGESDQLIDVVRLMVAEWTPAFDLDKCSPALAFW